MPIFLRSDAVANMLGLPSSAAFLARRDRLEEDLYFPLPMPHSARPLLWKTAEVEAWVNSYGRPNQPGIDPALIASGKVALLELARTA